jgi:hypothetical protein
MITIKLDAAVLSDPAVCEAFVYLVQQLSPHSEQLGEPQGGALVTFEGPSGSKVYLKTSTHELLEAAQQQMGLQFSTAFNSKRSDKSPVRKAKKPKSSRRPLKQSEVSDWLSALQSNKALFVERLRAQGSVTHTEAYRLLEVPPKQQTLKRLNGILGTIARWSGPNGDSIIVPWESKEGAYHWREELIAQG